MRLERAFLLLSDAQETDNLAVLIKRGTPLAWEQVTGERPFVDSQLRGGTSASRSWVIVGPSGAGKTTEMRQRAQILRERRILSFFLPAVKLVECSVEEALSQTMSPEVRVEFEAWKSGDGQAVFLVDALDEAMRVAHDGCAMVVQRIRKAIVGAEERTRLVFSTRIGFWTRHDFAAVGSILPQPIEIAGKDDHEPGRSVDKVHVSDSMKREFVESNRDGVPVVEIQLAPLSRVDAIRLACAWDVGDPASFEQAIDEHEVIEWKLSPAQLRVLVDYFRDHGRLGTWSEMLEAVIEESLRERNRMHGLDRRLTRSESWFALERVAAALVLGKKTDIAVPGEQCPRGAVDIEELLDWEVPKAREVLDLGLFDGTNRGTACFRTRGMADFLAARWLTARSQTHWQAKFIREQLVAKTYPGSRRRVPDVLGSVAGWVAVRVPLVRAALLQHAPHIALAEGDPCVLPIVALREAIRRFCEDRARGRWTNSWPTPGTFRQMARCDVGNVIVELLRVHRAHKGALLFLLHVVQFGKLEVCAPAALDMALDPSCPPRVRAAAVSVVGAAGSKAVRARLSERMRRRKRVHSALKAPLIRTLFGREWDVDDLLRIVGANPRRDVQVTLGAIVVNAPRSQLARLLEVAAAPSEDGPAWGSLCVARLVLRILVELSEASWPVTLGAYLVTLDDSLHDLYDADLCTNLRQEMVRHLNARRQFVMAFAGKRRSRQMHLPFDGTRRLFQLSLGDLPYLVDLYVEDSQRSDIAFAIAKLVESHGEEEAQRALGDTQPRRRAVIRHFSPRPSHEQQPRVDKHDAARAKVMAESRQVLLEHLEGIADGTNGDALAWLCQHVDGPFTKYGSVSLTTIRRSLGDEIAEAMIDGLQYFWRMNRPPPPVPASNRTPYVAIIGLRGLELEARRDHLFGTLDGETATTAAWFAMHEINGLPPWFDRLLAEHDPFVRPVLTAVVEREWDTREKCYGLLASALHESQRTQTAVAEVAASLLLERLPGNAATFSDALSAILAHRGVRSVLDARLPQLIAEFERDGMDEDYVVACLRAWSHVAPGDVSNWLERARDSSAPSFNRRVLLLAAALGEEIDERAVRRGRPMVDIDSWSTAIIARWIRFVFPAVPTSADRAHNRSDKPAGMYAVTARDYAERFRDHLLGALGKNTSTEARRMLRGFRGESFLGSRKRSIPRMLQRQAQTNANAQMRVWTERDVIDFENKDEIAPRDTRDLLTLVRHHLEWIAEEVERGDFRCVALFARLGRSANRTVSERDIQLWLAQTLKLASRGLYEVAREPEVDARKKPDISAVTGGCSRVPIEIKPVDSYSLRELEDCLQNQLIGQYMKPEFVRHGVLVIASLGVKKRWKLPSGPADFRELCAVLQRRADTYAARHSLEEIAVVGIRLAE